MNIVARRQHGKTTISDLYHLEAAIQSDKILISEKVSIAHLGTPEEVIGNSELFSSFRR